MGWEIRYLPAYEDRPEYSEMLEYKIQPPGNYPEESIKYSEQGKSLKSRKIMHMFLLQERRLTKIGFRGTGRFNIFDKSFACVTVNVVWKLALEGLNAV
jgi:hypothetical protein